MDTVDLEGRMRLIEEGQAKLLEALTLLVASYKTMVANNNDMARQIGSDMGILLNLALNMSVATGIIREDDRDEILRERFGPRDKPPRTDN